jgi:(p)ppGpp synthase/HD superfamily hydrolase
MKEMIELSKKYCVEKHGDIKRKNGNLYYEHPIRVADMVSKYTDDSDVIIASYLHDIFEHGSGDEKEILEIFNERVLGIIKELTNDNEMIKIKGKFKYLIEKFNSLPAESLLIKLCDRYDNLIDSGSKPVYVIETGLLINFIDRPLTESHLSIIDLIKSICDN